MITLSNTTSTTIVQIQSGDVEYTAAAVGNVGLGAQLNGATIDFTTSTLNAQFIGVGGGGQTGAGIWLDIDAPNDFFDRFVETSGSLVTFNATTEAGVARSYSVGEGSIIFSPLLPATDSRPFEHFEVTFFEPVTPLDPGVNNTIIVPGDSVITLGLRIQHNAFEDTQFDPDFGMVHIEFTSSGPLPDLPRQFTVAQKAKFQADADALNTITNGLGVLDGSVGSNPAARLANLIASQAASTLSPQVGTANSAVQSALSLTDALISAPTNPIALPLSLASALANATAGILQALASDPPDAGFLDVFDAPDWSFGDLDGVSAAGNALVQDAWALFQETLNLLVAAERYQGADLASDAVAQTMQEAAFDAALTRFNLQRGAMSDSLTAFLDELSADSVADLAFEDDTSLADVQAHLAGLNDPATEDTVLAAWIASMTGALPGLLVQPGPEDPSFIAQAVADALGALATAVPSGATGSVFDALDVAAAILAAPASEQEPNDVITGTDGDDTLTGTDGDDQIAGGSGNDSITGGDGNDSIAASDGDDVVNGGAGDDQIGGGFGNDTIDGGDGDDVMGAGFGDDSVSGGNGHDVVAGGAGNDTLDGGAGNDSMSGSFGHDLISGGGGDDDIGGGTGRDTIDAGAGNDSVGGGEGDDDISGGDGNDFLAGGGRDDLIDGGAGNDTINGGAGNDDITGGLGADQFVFSAFNSGETDVIRDFEDGVDSFFIRIINPDTGEANISNGGNGLAGFVAALGIVDTAAGAQMNVNGHQVLVEGMAAADLTTADFSFL